MATQLERFGQLERYLQQEKIERDDTTAYVDGQLTRQRVINEAVIGFAEEFIPKESVVIDTCAGPEGSYLAATRREYRWFGNDISQRFSETLARTGANVVLSDFSKAPFKSACADATVFVFALNNICSPDTALAEAKRVTKPEGVIVEAEPGLSAWSGKIIFHSLLSENPDLAEADPIRFNKAGEIIKRQFEGKPYTEHEFVDLLLRNTVHKTREELADKLRSLYATCPRYNVFFRFQQYLIENYFNRLDQTRRRLGLEIEKAGILVAGLVDKDWLIPEIIEVSPEQWIQEVLAVRKWVVEDSPTVQKFPRSLDHSSKRVVAPVLCFKTSFP